MVLAKTLESPLDCKEIQPVHSEGDQPWDFFGRTDVKAETPILWPPHVKSWLTGKDSDAGRDWGQEEKGMTEDEMAGWHNWLDGRESGWTLEVGDGQGGLACYNSWSHKELDTTERLNWTELNATVLELFVPLKLITETLPLPKQCLKIQLLPGWAEIHIYLNYPTHLQCENRCFLDLQMIMHFCYLFVSCFYFDIYLYIQGQALFQRQVFLEDKRRTGKLHG